MNKSLILRIIKYYGIYSFLFFVASFLIGVFIVQAYPGQAEEVYKEVLNAFSPLLDIGPLEMVLFIFFNNTITVFLGMALGIFFMLPTLFFLFINGLVLGLVSSFFYSQYGLFILLSLLLPHGIFELPAVFIGSGLGLWLGFSAWSRMRQGKLREFLTGEELKNSVKICVDVFFMVIIPLLAVAAIIETVLIFL